MEPKRLRMEQKMGFGAHAKVKVHMSSSTTMKLYSIIFAWFNVELFYINHFYKTHKNVLIQVHESKNNLTKIDQNILTSTMLSKTTKSPMKMSEDEVLLSWTVLCTSKETEA